jgi:hypothetical protein
VELTNPTPSFVRTALSPLLLRAVFGVALFCRLDRIQFAVKRVQGSFDQLRRTQIELLLQPAPKLVSLK